MKPSDRHPLGFDAPDLLRLFGYRLRLHLWHGTPSQAPHDHRWWLLSLPLWGRFVERRYRTGFTYLTFGGPLVRTDVYPPDAEGNRRHEPIGREWLFVDTVRTRRPLRPYFCRLGVIHSYVPRGRRGLSLVLTGPPRAEFSHVWFDPEEGSRG